MWKCSEACMSAVCRRLRAEILRSGSSFYRRSMSITEAVSLAPDLGRLILPKPFQVPKELEHGIQRSCAGRAGLGPRSSRATFPLVRASSGGRSDGGAPTAAGDPGRRAHRLTLHPNSALLRCCSARSSAVSGPAREIPRAALGLPHARRWPSDCALFELFVVAAAAQSVRTGSPQPRS